MEFFLLLLIPGLVLGLATGSWWALLAAVIPAAWIGIATTDTEFDEVFSAVAYGLVLGGLAAAIGVVLRKLANSVRSRLRSDREGLADANVSARTTR